MTTTEVDWSAIAAGLPQVVDVPSNTRKKIRRLLDALWTPAEIAAAARMPESDIRALADGRIDTMLSEEMVRIACIHVDQIPYEERARVDGTGLRRRLNAMALRRIGWRTVARECGYPETTVQGWMEKETAVPGRAAAAFAAYYEKHRGVIGSAAGPVVRYALERGALPDHAWTAETIDDPRARPDRTMRSPHPVRRRLKALIRDGHGPARLGALLHEPADRVLGWADSGPVPVYILPFVVAVFDRLAGQIGPDRAAADRAKRRRWRSCMSWYGIDIDDPSAVSRVGAGVPKKKADVDEEQVENALLGFAYRADLTADELEIVVRDLADGGKGLTAAQIARRLRWADPVDAAAVDAVKRYLFGRNIKVRFEEQGPPYGWYGNKPRPHRRVRPLDTVDAGVLRAESAA